MTSSSEIVARKVSPAILRDVNFKILMKPTIMQKQMASLSTMFLLE